MLSYVRRVNLGWNAYDAKICGTTYRVDGNHYQWYDADRGWTSVRRKKRITTSVPQPKRSLLVTKLVSTVSFTMLTRIWLLRLPFLAQTLLNCGISIEQSGSNDPRRQQSRQTYIIKHCGCNKQVRDGVCGDPGLVGHSHLVREQFILFNGFTVSKISRVIPSMNPSRRYDCCN
jgi:hypothetical protein